jgi:PAS domain S-box-containing protein
VLVTLTATVLRWLLQPFIGFEFPFITYFAAVFVTAWWFGFKPTLLTVLLSALLTNLLFFSPAGSDGWTGYLLGFVGLALFVGIGVGTAYMGKGRLDAQRRAETASTAAGWRESERQFSDMLHNLELVSMMLDREARITYCNDYLLRLTGWQLEEVIGRSWPELFLPSDVVDELRGVFAALLADQEVAWHHENEIVTRSGTRLLIRWNNSLLRSASGDVIGTASIGEDITERRRSEAALEQAHKELIGADSLARKQAEAALLKARALESAILNSANFSCIATDAKGIIQIFNVGAERMLGYTAADVVNTITPADISDPQEVIARAKALSAELETPITPGFEALVFKASRAIEDIYELTYIRKDGSRFPALVSVTALRDPHGAIIGYLLIGTDHTARKQVEEDRKNFEDALQQKNVELEDASRMKSEFLANMSHELRTPLNSIIGFSEVLSDGLAGEMTEQQRGFVGDIFGSGRHLLSLINDILDLSKVEAGKMTLELEPLQVSSLFANSLSIIREKAAAHQIRLSMKAAEGLGAIQVDARKVKQIVYNLLSNAVKFTKDGGQVILGASRVPRADVGRLSGSWTGRSFPLAESEFTDFLKITVTDTGIGISAEGSDRLFKPFSQIDSGLSRRFQGTGLGLVMVKLLTELHGGAVAVESAVAEGSRFTVWLPLRALEGDGVTSVPAEAAPRIEALEGAPLALVVEGDFKSADLIRVQLAAGGFDVLHAASAEAALVLAVQQPLALITLDIMLPNMDGWQFLSRIKKVPELRRIPVVIISIATDRNKGFSLGAAAVMQKPIARQELYEALVDLGLLPLSQGRTLKVLVVDDDPQAVELIALRVTGLASTVLRAYGGQEAIDVARRELPDVMVIDLMMPDVTGFDVVAALNEDPDTARIPILVVTAK